MPAKRTNKKVETPVKVNVPMIEEETPVKITIPIDPEEIERRVTSATNYHNGNIEGASDWKAGETRIIPERLVKQLKNDLAWNFKVE